MLDQMGIFISRHADHVEKRAGARDGAMPSWISTWSQENPPLGLENQCYETMPWECGKCFTWELGKFQMKILTCMCFKKISSQIFLM